MSERRRVLWLNGPFGGGKTSVARALVAAQEDAVLFDPERLGALLRDTVPVPTGDFQHLPEWRELLVETVASLHRHRSALVVMPMTVLRRDYLNELLTGLQSTGAEVLHVLLDVSHAELERRIAADTTEPARAAEWRTEKLTLFIDARAWLLPHADLVVSTDEASAEQVAVSISALLTRTAAVSSVEFRRYQDRDAEAVRRLHNIALQATGAHAGTGPWDDDLSSVREVYIESGGEFLVGVLGSDIVAMGALRPINDTVAELKRMRVEPDFQGQGLGRQMLTLLEDAAVSHGFEELQLDTTEAMTAALHLYASAGYREFNRTAGPSPFEMVLMRKQLDPRRP